MLYVSFYKTLSMAMLVLILTPASSYSFTQTLTQKQNVGTRAQSYGEWKNFKILAAQLKIKSLKEKIDVDPNLLIRPSASEAGLSRELEMEILKLTLTQDLTISDYFVGFLTKDVAEPMSNYAQDFFQMSPTVLKASSGAE